MATTTFVYPYKQGSKSATALAQGLEGKVIKLENSKFKPTNKKVVVNWGSQSLPEDFANSGVKVINDPKLVSQASNKAKFFQLIKDSPEEQRPNIPEFTFDKEVVKEWINGEKPKLVFARTVLNGHSGQGIVKITKEEDLEGIADNTLFVEYVLKKREFRVHVSKLGVFCVQEKLRKKEVPDELVDFQIRNVANGFVFSRNNVEIPELCLQESIKTLNLLKLDFVAIDVIYNERKELAYVLEANTAPGLENTTILEYVEEMRKLVHE